MYTCKLGGVHGTVCANILCEPFLFNVKHSQKWSLYSITDLISEHPLTAFCLFNILSLNLLIYRDSTRSSCAQGKPYRAALASYDYYPWVSLAWHPRPHQTPHSPYFFSLHIIHIFIWCSIINNGTVFWNNYDSYSVFETHVIMF